MRKIERETEIPQEASKKEEKEIKKVVKTPAPKMSKDDFLETVTSISVTKDTKAVKKNGIPMISPKEMAAELDPKKENEEVIRLQNLSAAVDEIVKQKKAEKEAKAARETKEAELIDFVLPIYNEDGFGGNFHKSYYVKGEKETVTFVTSDRFSAPRDEEIAELTEVLGDRFSDVIGKEVELKIRPEIFNSKILQKELMDLMPKGEDGRVDKEVFAKFFAATTTWSVTEGFDQKRFSLPKKTFEKVMNILKQSKPSIK